MKKRLIILLVFALCLSLMPTVSFAELNYNPDKIIVSDFTCSMDTLTAGNLVISCKIELLDKEALSQNYAFLSVVKSDGKIVSRDIKSGTLSKGENKPLSNTVAIPQSQDYSKIKVETYFWDSLKDGRVIAPMATYGSQDNTLKDIYIDGVKLDGFEGTHTEFEYELPVSYMRTPEIRIIPSDNSSKVTMSEMDNFPCDLKITVTPASGIAKIYTLKLKIKDGTVSNAYMKAKDGTTKALTSAKLKLPQYAGAAPGDSGFDWEEDYPTEKTLVYSDRTMYYTDWPQFLDDAVAVQTSLQLIRYDANYKDAAYADAKMGGFTINRSADIYLYCTPRLPAWAEKDGYALCDDAKVKIYYANQGNKNPLTHSAYKRSVIVPEGETREIRIGAAVNALGEAVNDFYILVDFISPTQIGGLNNLGINGISDFVFDENITEYNIILNEGTTVQPEITYDVIGAGATVSEEVTGTVPGKKVITVTSADGKSVKKYTFNFDVFTTKLSGINLDGIALDGFDSETYEYTVTLKNNWTSQKGLPTVTATAPDGVEFIVTQAVPNDVGDPMIATIEASAEKGIDKVYKVKFVIDPNPPLYPDVAELKTILIDNVPVDMQYVDNTNTYYKYLPYGSSYPEIIAAATDDTGAEITVVQADETNPDAKITITSYDETITNEYTVKFIISESESDDAKYDFYENILNDYAYKSNTENSVRTDLKSGDNYVYIYAGDIVGTRTNYAPYMGIFQTDISSLTDADLSGIFEMSIRYFALSIGESGDKGDENLKAKISFYDMSDDVLWGTDDLNGTKSKDIVGNTSNKKPFASFEYGNVEYGTNIYQKLDVSEFIRKCIREDNLTPSIGIRVEMPEQNEYTYANSYARTTFTLYANGTNRFIINYKK